MPARCHECIQYRVYNIFTRFSRIYTSKDYFLRIIHALFTQISRTYAHDSHTIPQVVTPINGIVLRDNFHRDDREIAICSAGVLSETLSPYPAREKEKDKRRESAMFVCNRYRCQVFCNFCPTALKEAMQIGQMACAREGPSSEVKNTVAGTMGKKFLRHAKDQLPCGSSLYP